MANLPTNPSPPKAPAKVTIPGPTEMLEPAKSGAISKTSRPNHGLLGVKFRSRCPPVVPLDAYVVAVTGPNDFAGNASPQNDGWFISDWALFKHLLYERGHKQFWLSCVDPKTLVKKYGEYLHGDPRYDRKVVLDTGSLPLFDDVVVTKEEDLKETFLDYVQQALREVKGTDRPILLMLFGHGYDDPSMNTGIHLGGTGSQRRDGRQKDYVTASELKRVIQRENPGANVTVMTTACYGGAWCYAESGNITSLHGCDADHPILSHRVSETIRARNCGSRWATGLAETLCRFGFEDGITRDDNPGTPTYAALIKTVEEVLLQEVEENSEKAKRPSFSAKDDAFGQSWRERSGFPLTDYRDIYDSLPVVPGPQPAPQAVAVSTPAAGLPASSSNTSGNLSNPSTNTSPGGSSKVGSATKPSTMSMGSVRKALYMSLPASVDRNVAQGPEAARKYAELLMHSYMRSNPGVGEVAYNNRLHNKLKHLEKGRELSMEDLEEVIWSLQYRLHEVLARSNQYKERLGEDAELFPWCHQADIDALKDDFLGSDKTRCRQIFGLASKYKKELFVWPNEQQGVPHDNKSWQYVALLMNSTGWGLERIEEVLAGWVAEMKQEEEAAKVSRIMKLGEYKQLWRAFKDHGRGRKRSFRIFEDDEKPSDAESSGAAARRRHSPKRRSLIDRVLSRPGSPEREDKNVRQPLGEHMPNLDLASIPSMRSPRTSIDEPKERAEDEPETKPKRRSSIFRRSRG